MTALVCLIRLLLDTPDMDIWGRDGEAVICRYCPGHCPEDYVSVKDMQGSYAICETHRDKEVVRVWAGDVEEASVLAAALGGRMFHTGANPDAARQIRGYVAQGHEDQAARFLAGRLDRVLYCIGEEDPSRVSMVKKGQMVDVRFARRNLVEGASLSRAYAVLYNYGKMLGEAHGLCQKAGKWGWKQIPKRSLACICLVMEDKEGKYKEDPGSCFAYTGYGGFIPWPSFCVQNLPLCTHTSIG